jgi:hypothetical protein
MKSKLVEANGEAALSPCTQAMSSILRRAWRNMLERTVETDEFCVRR